MQLRTFLLFAVMIALFAFYVTMGFQAMPEIQSGLKAQTELLNSLDANVSAPAAEN